MWQRVAVDGDFLWRIKKKKKNISRMFFTKWVFVFMWLKSQVKERLTLTSPIMSLTNPSTSAPSRAPVLLCGEKHWWAWAAFMWFTSHSHHRGGHQLALAWGQRGAGTHPGAHGYNSCNESLLPGDSCCYTHLLVAQTLPQWCEAVEAISRCYNWRQHVN